MIDIQLDIHTLLWVKNGQNLDTKRYKKRTRRNGLNLMAECSVCCSSALHCSAPTSINPLITLLSIPFCDTKACSFESTFAKSLYSFCLLFTRPIYLELQDQLLHKRIYLVIIKYPRFV